MPRGWDRPLYVQLFDHRGSFQSGLFGWKVPLSDAQTSEIAGSKQIICDGFRAGLAGSAPAAKAASLVDEQFGAAILRDAKAKGITEGLDRREDCQQIVATARAGRRNHVGCIVLGRGEDDAKVREWLGVAAKVPDFVGFAVGRTVFWDPLVAWHAGKATREQAVSRVAGRYREFVDLFEEG
jgi:myo-inositol catabolism protein IolC